MVARQDFTAVQDSKLRTTCPDSIGVKGLDVTSFPLLVRRESLFLTRQNSRVDEQIIGIIGTCLLTGLIESSISERKLVTSYLRLDFANGGSCGCHFGRQISRVGDQCLV